MRAAEQPLIVHLIDRLPPDGAERLLVDLMRYRSPRFRYAVGCLVEGGPLEAELLALEVPVHRFGKRRRYDLACLRRLTRWLRDKRPRAVHTHLFTADTWGRLAARLARVPGIYSTVHSANDWKGRTERLIDRALARCSTRIVACSETVRASLIERDRIAAARVTCIPNGVDLARVGSPEPAPLRAEFDFPPQVPILAVIGRLHPAKGHRDLLPALSALREQGLDFRVLIVGEGPLREELESAIASRDLGPRVILTGQRGDVPALLAALDALVIPSRWEGLPIVLLEAMARGCPIVASRVGGIPDAVRDAREGLLVPPGDPDALAAALARLLASPELRRELGANAARRARERYDAAATMRAYEALYDDLEVGA